MQGHPGQFFRYPGILLAKKRNHLVPDPVAEKLAALIGTILHMGNAPFFQKCLHLLTGNQKHRSDNAAPNW